MRAFRALVAAVALIGVPQVVAMESDCTAETTVTLQNKTEQDQNVHMEFQVDITTEQSCSRIAFDVVLDLKLPNGQWKSVRLSRQAEVEGGSASQTVEHTMADLELLEFRASATSCNRCEL